jgi:branched-chain amino acid aminotransferase
MNLWVRIGDTAITPPLDGTILGGITRNSLLTILREQGFKTEERRISLDEIAEADKRGDLLEIFGSGTAAVVSPVGELTWDGGSVKPKGGDLAKRLRKELEDLFAGRIDDKRGWMVAVP